MVSVVVVAAVVVGVSGLKPSRCLKRSARLLGLKVVVVVVVLGGRVRIENSLSFGLVVVVAAEGASVVDLSASSWPRWAQASSPDCRMSSLSLILLKNVEGVR